MGRFWIFFLSHTMLRFQLWFYFHLYMWVVHWALLLRLPWKTWVCPSENQVWQWYSYLGRRGSGSTRYSGGLAARVAGNIVLQKGVASNLVQYTPVFLPGEPPSLTEEEATVYRVTKSRTLLKRPCMHRRQELFCLWQLCPSES